MTNATFMRIILASLSDLTDELNKRVPSGFGPWTVHTRSNTYTWESNPITLELHLDDDGSHFVTDVYILNDRVGTYKGPTRGYGRGVSAIKDIGLDGYTINSVHRAMRPIKQDVVEMLKELHVLFTGTKRTLDEVLLKLDHWRTVGDYTSYAERDKLCADFLRGIDLEEEREKLMKCIKELDTERL